MRSMFSNLKKIGILCLLFVDDYSYVQMYSIPLFDIWHFAHV